MIDYNTDSLILVGNPDSGKTNFLARLWLALQSKKFRLIASQPPSDIKYVEDIAAHILSGKFVPRTEKENLERNFEVSLLNVEKSQTANIVIPDVSGEMWKRAVEKLEIPKEWHNALENSIGALLFLRIHSDLNVQPTDWVTCRELIKHGLGNEDKQNEVPTQIAIIELLRILENTLKIKDGKKPKVALMISAWDLVNKEDADKGPEFYLNSQFPLLAGRLKDIKSLEIKIYALSIVGGDFLIEDFVKQFLEEDFEDKGYVISRSENNDLVKVTDITEPINWLLE